MSDFQIRSGEVQKFWRDRAADLGSACSGPAGRARWGPGKGHGRELFPYGTSSHTHGYAIDFINPDWDLSGKNRLVALLSNDRNRKRQKNSWRKKNQIITFGSQLLLSSLRARHSICVLSFASPESVFALHDVFSIYSVPFSRDTLVTTIIRMRVTPGTKCWLMFYDSGKMFFLKENERITKIDVFPLTKLYTCARG